MIFHSVPDFEFAAVPPRHGPDIYSVISILSFFLSFPSLCFGREREGEVPFLGEEATRAKRTSFFLFFFLFHPSVIPVDLFLSMDFCFLHAV